jgi:hypothetical protein
MTPSDLCIEPVASFAALKHVIASNDDQTGGVFYWQSQSSGLFKQLLWIDESAVCLVFTLLIVSVADLKICINSKMKTRQFSAG